MTSLSTEFPARGKVSRVTGSQVVFCPSNTNYELQLDVAPEHLKLIPVGLLVEGVIRATGRKLLSVPAGGNFIAPIFGPPKTIQGRVRTLDERTLVVQAGTSVVVDLPEQDNALDLNNGTVGVGSFVNVIVLPGATFEFLKIAD